MSTRRAAVAGAFYPGGRDVGNMVDNFLKSVPEASIEGELKALIVPHAGYVYSGKVAAYAYALLRKYKKSRIILLGPSHHVYFNDVVSDVNEYWETPLGRVKVAESSFPKLGEAHLDEHCLEVQLPFLQRIFGEFEILPLVAGDADPRAIAKKLVKMLDDKTILIASSDMSHYHDYDTAVKLDKAGINTILELDYDKARAELDACGKIPIMTVIDLAKRLGWKCKLLDYKNSGDATGDKSSVVGYASLAFY